MVPVSSSASSRVSRVRLTEVSSIGFVEFATTVSAPAWGEASASTRSTRVPLTREPVSASPLLEEVTHPWTRLHLVLIIPERGELLLLWYQKGARVHGMSVSATYPTDVRAAIR